MLLAVSALLLPMRPDDSWKPEADSISGEGIFFLLAMRVGLPYLLLAATGPLFQSWLVQTRPGYSPFRLFALSNAGSLCALLLYPFAMEPFLTRATQATFWSIGYGAFLASALACAWFAWRHAAPSPVASPLHATSATLAMPSARSKLFWIALSAAPSLLLLATTNHLCQELPSFPFLWVLPLSAYLLTFILCFESERFYRRPALLVVMALALTATCYLLRIGMEAGSRWTIAGFTAALFVCSFACHGELSLRKPAPQHLSVFYLCIAAGGALGGIFAGIVAPRVFAGYFELYLALFLCPLLVLASFWKDPQCDLHAGKPKMVWAVLVLGMGMLGYNLGYCTFAFFREAIFHTRDFFGVIRVYEVRGENPPLTYRIMTHGAINHGYQCIDPPDRRRTPAGYYGKESGAHEAFRLCLERGPLRVGVVGLGAGTIAGYGRKGDTIRFYEISPAVERVAREQFYYLSESFAECSVVIGDARRSLENEESQNFDILILDAFNSDSIPAHLLTREAFETYKRHLKPDGILAPHVSNKFLNLEPLIRGLGAEIGLDAVFLSCPADLSRGTIESDWGLLCAERTRLDPLRKKDEQRGQIPDALQGKPWTDEFGSVLQIMK